MANYWNRRKIKDEEKEIFEKGLIEVARHEKIFDEAIKNIDSVIKKYTYQYGLLNSEKLRTKDLIYGKDLETLKIDLEKYIELSKAISGAKPSERIMAIDRALKKASLSHRINKLEAIKVRIKSELELMNQARTESLSEHLTNVYNITSQYDEMPLRYDVLKNTFNQKWVGNKNFSERIWKSTEKLENNISNMLQRLNAGALYPETIYAELASKFNVEKWKAKRLVLTESSHIMNRTRLDNYKLMDIGEVEIIATLDFKTSDICQEKDGQIVKLSEAVVGIDLPPFHPNCRTVFAPKSDKKIGERAYRDPETGKTKYTNAKTYKEWVKEIGEPKWQVERKKHYNKARDKEQFTIYKNTIGINNLPKTFASFQELKYNDSRKYIDLKTRYYIKTKAKLTVHQGKQGKHILGHNNYQGGSYVFDTIDIQKLVNKYAGNGDLKISKNKWNNIEFIEHNENIGIFVNIDKTELYETKRFSIHYSKSGVHIVPRKEN